MTTKLKVKTDYTCRALSYRGGTTIEVDPDLASFLLRDAPENFDIVSGDEPTEPKIRELGQGPSSKGSEASRNKQVREPGAKK